MHSALVYQYDKVKFCLSKDAVVLEEENMSEFSAA